MKAERLLKPFAQYADAFDHHDAQMAFGVSIPDDSTIATIGDLIAARDFIK